MRLALLSDVHGNPIALDAVLADVAAHGGVDGYWVLGDLAAVGYDPVGALERLAALPGVQCTQGNTDRYVVTGDRPPPRHEDVKANWSLLPRLVDLAHLLAWTQGYVTAAGWFDWLAALPLERRLTLPNGTRLLGTHVAPGCNDGLGINPTVGDADLRGLLSGCEADLVCVGHTHWPLERSVDGVRVVNVGSVSNPFPPDLRASYVLLQGDERGYRLEFRRVDYDRQAVIDAVHRAHHPAGQLIIEHFLGHRRPPWTAD